VFVAAGLAVMFRQARAARVSVVASNGSVDIVVADTGAGIATEFLPHVFERFRQGDAGTTKRHGGLGLGLAIARQLAELHGGRIDADSAGPGRGATFRVRLPPYAAAGEAGARLSGSG
jgi:signal transduction histidine kinase